MIFTARMTQLIAVVLDHDGEAVTRELLRQSVLHFIDTQDLSRDWKTRVAGVTPRVSAAIVAETRKRIESLLSLAQLIPPPVKDLDVDDLRPVDIEGANKTLDTIGAELQGVRERQRAIQQEVLKLEDIRRQVGLFGDISDGMRAGSPYSYLKIRTGSLTGIQIDPFSTALKALPSVQLNFQEEEGRTNLLVITMKRDDKQVDKLLDKHGWVDVELPPAAGGARDDVLSDLESRLVTFKEEQEDLDRQLKEAVTNRQEELDRMWANLRMNELYYRIQSFFSRTSRTVIFSGWLPAEKRTAMEAGLLRVTGGRCFLEWSESAEVGRTENVPVQLNNPGFLAPFQMLVQNFATPEYGTVDPTPFVAVAYLTMFGLMFGDAGQGAVLLLLGLAGSLFLRGLSSAWRNILRLLAWCGGSSIVSGILFGSYFGMPWFKPLWFDYHGVVTGHVGSSAIRDVYDILAITIYFGIIVIGLGLVLNWVNLFNRRHWLELVMDKAGLLGGWIYGAGVYAAFFFVKHDYKTLPPGDVLFVLIGVPVLLLMAKPILEFFLHHGKEGKKFTLLTPVDWIMQWIVELLEIFSGYLANTLSFMRVAGLGIAHVSLMVAFFAIARMIGDGGFTVWSYLILVLGNTMVIALEGLSAGIQSLRLNYYEFFSKYFNGSGLAYTPVSLHNPNT